MQTFNAIRSAKLLLAEKLKTASLAIDATAGNGHDTLFLAKNTPDAANILAFDIQQSAIEATRKLLLQENLLYKVNLYCTSHADILNFLDDSQDIDVAMFNLGYLPGGNHSVVTTVNSTIPAIQAVLDLLNQGGILSVTAYPGHEEGRDEEQALSAFFTKLSYQDFTVIRLAMLNHFNNPPVLYMVEKVKKR